MPKLGTYASKSLLDVHENLCKISFVDSVARRIPIEVDNALAVKIDNCHEIPSEILKPYFAEFEGARMPLFDTISLNL